LVHGERIFVAGATGQVKVLDAREPARVLHRWSLAGKPTSDLFVRSGRVLAVVDERMLVSLTSADGAMADEPEWKSARRPGAICGQPLVHGDALIVSDASGAICGLHLADGKQVWQTQLAAGQAPAAAPAVMADRFLLVPLIDGALAVLPMPGADAEVAEANP
jgi:outer membrane protein assembly factor BamB